MENIYICSELEELLTRQRYLNKLTKDESLPIFNIGDVINHVKNCPLCKHNFIEYIEINLRTIETGNDVALTLIKPLISKIIERIK